MKQTQIPVKKNEQAQKNGDQKFRSPEPVKFLGRMCPKISELGQKT
jgi:hypothetical protein